MITPAELDELERLVRDGCWLTVKTDLSLIAEVRRLQQTIAPVAAWAKATLQSKHDNQDGFVPEDTVAYRVNDVKLTVSELRKLAEVNNELGIGPPE